MAIRKWATRNLRPGDLTALAEIARARYADTQAERIERLNRRGFVKNTADKPIVTLLGRTALWVRHFTKHWAA